jgi:hypothetical protein
VSVRRGDPGEKVLELERRVDVQVFGGFTLDKH